MSGEWAYCPDCKRYLRLRKDGLLPKHKPPRFFDMRKQPDCDGSEAKP